MQKYLGISLNFLSVSLNLRGENVKGKLNLFII